MQETHHLLVRLPCGCCQETDYLLKMFESLSYIQETHHLLVMLQLTLAGDGESPEMFEPVNYAGDSPFP